MAGSHSLVSIAGITAPAHFAANLFSNCGANMENGGKSGGIAATVATSATVPHRPRAISAPAAQPDGCC
jgi:hypothetical protein